MRIFGKEIGYDEPFFYFGPWEFLIHDNGWTLAKHRIVQKDGRWPTYWTIRPWRRRRISR